jgi:hypothetical protein
MEGNARTWFTPKQKAEPLDHSPNCHISADDSSGPLIQRKNPGLNSAYFLQLLVR